MEFIKFLLTTVAVAGPTTPIIYNFSVQASTLLRLTPHKPAQPSNVSKRYHLLTLHGKITGWDFYRSLETETNAMGVKPPDRYQVFLRIAREYRHLLSLKRAGRGYDSRGMLGTTPGELAVRCPACPRPGVNLPDD
ncbi:CxC2 domain-containing protein [Mycena indigotica]|uniref:CxC2 domain-containing protein n=1 Tax=Mycena indigotica TaxID=2126181 RepID=A0A8H6SKS1_9AGAR|nr:CxC2 domain-containing protein [Mycena indigotica]KAF7301159.1 CxC2 domain-containing protein [Mycena indigotica]